MACLLSIRFPEIRRRVLNHINNHSLRKEQYATLQYLKNNLAYESLEEVEAELALYGFTVSDAKSGKIEDRYMETKQAVYARTLTLCLSMAF